MSSKVSEIFKSIILMHSTIDKICKLCKILHEVYRKYDPIFIVTATYKCN